ncbi:MAG: hypothetical protein IJ565_05855 [Bacilli bacterium]|nr:hypothetical protein [Bacilli bacterium]
MINLVSKYIDLTDDIRKHSKSSDSIERRLIYAMDKDKNVYLDAYYDPRDIISEEIKYQKIMENKTGFKFFLNPKTHIQNVKTPDFWVKDTNELWDYKGIDGSSKNTIDNIMHKAEYPTYNLILHQRKTNLDILYIVHEINRIFATGKRIKIKQVILLDKNDNVVLYYKR